jgi:uncharacterized protein (TIGR02646 family)
MRRVTQGKIPPVLDGPDSPGGKEIADAIAFYAVPANAEKELPGGFEAYSDPAVRTAINETFNFKCAYCESSFGAVHPVDVEHFRPKAAVDVGGKKPRKPGYYWLAARWDNLLASCIFCNRENRHVMPDGSSRVTGKGNGFPLTKETDRAIKPGDEKKEARLLLNPYLDKPDTHLAFDGEGLVRARPGAGGKESAKGAKSIEVYGLLRRELVHARADIAKDVAARIKRLEDLWKVQQQAPSPALLAVIQDDIAQLKGRMEPDQPYSAMVNQLAKPFLKTFMH